jgi:hypothetical protein
MYVCLNNYVKKFNIYIYYTILYYRNIHITYIYYYLVFCIM